MVGIAVATIVLSICVMKAQASAAMKMSTRRSGAITGAARAPSLVVSAGITLLSIPLALNKNRLPRAKAGTRGDELVVTLNSRLRRNDGKGISSPFS